MHQKNLSAEEGLSVERDNRHSVISENTSYL
jgi:hypothetical protein